MPKPNPEKFARLVLWKLSHLQASVTTLENQVQAFINRQNHTSEAEAEKLRTLWTERNRKLADRLLRSALEEAGLQSPPNEHR